PFPGYSVELLQLFVGQRDLNHCFGLMLVVTIDNHESGGVARFAEQAKDKVSLAGDLKRAIDRDRLGPVRQGSGVIDCHRLKAQQRRPKLGDLLLSPTMSRRRVEGLPST